MTTATTSLERSLQNCSLNQSTTHTNRRGGADSGGLSCRSSSSSEPPEIIHHNHNNQMKQRSHRNNPDEAIHSSFSSSDDNPASLNLNSHHSLPRHWEQCLDLKSGELNYVNWRTGEKSKEDPRTTSTGYDGDYYSEDAEEEVSNVYESEGSSTESVSCSRNRDCFKSTKRVLVRRHKTPSHEQQKLSRDLVLVVAGCKTCFMYYMVPKHVHECPKCSAHLLHFDANDISSPLDTF